MTGLWEGLDGQEQAVALLRHSAARPVHAYLVAGPRGSTFELGARHLAAALVAPDDADAVRRVLGGFHPDVVEFRPEGVMYTLANEIRAPRGGESFQRDRLLPRVIPEAHASPTEGAYKVIVIHEAERLQGNQSEAANMLLKTLEEPPPRTVMILTTSFPDELLETVRSRCQRVDFSGLVVAAPSPAEVDLRARFTDAVRALDGTGAAVERSVGLIDDALNGYLASLEATFDEEETATRADLEAAGYDDRTVQRLVRRLQEQRKRRLRRARRDALVEGITSFETIYRDVLAGPDAPRGDRPVLAADPRASVRALDACREARESLEHNPNESLLLERLLLHLPPVATEPIATVG
jgi:DNA polymerase-3 subunit delta'